MLVETGEVSSSAKLGAPPSTSLRKAAALRCAGPSQSQADDADISQLHLHTQTPHL